MIACVRKWVTIPLEMLHRWLTSASPLMLEANLAEGSDYFGKINAALNELVVRIRSEFQGQQVEKVSEGDSEKHLLEQITRAFIPDSRLFMADKDNQILADTGSVSGVPSEAGRHLLDLITDTNFANLVATAFQREGEVVRGEVVFQDKPYEAAVFKVPEFQSKSVKTLIALRPAA
jgi:hypothetical protein